MIIDTQSLLSSTELPTGVGQNNILQIVDINIPCPEVKNKEIVDMSICNENLDIGVEYINIPTSTLDDNVENEKVLTNTPKCLKR